MQASLFSVIDDTMKKAKEHDARQATRKSDDKKRRTQEASTRKRKARVSRGGKLKRHPSRAPAKKRVVKTKKVAMLGHEDGPLGDIMGRDGDTLYIQWPGMNRLYSHNAKYMISVEATDEN